MTVGDPLEVVGRPQLKDLAYERLRAAIVSLALPPGTPLREAQLSTQLGISKTPIREAFVRLVQDGLVEVAPYRGATVKGYTRDDLVEIFEMRELMEGFAARQAALNMTDEARRELQRNIRETRAALRKGDHEKLTELLNAFDRLLYAQATNRRVRELLDQLHYHVERIGLLTVGIPGRLKRSVDQHGEIAQAIMDRKADQAERRMRNHIRSVMADELESLDDGALDDAHH